MPIFLVVVIVRQIFSNPTFVSHKKMCNSDRSCVSNKVARCRECEGDVLVNRNGFPAVSGSF